MNRNPPEIGLPSLEHLYTISQIIAKSLNWKPALDEIIQLTRSFFIFDNLVVYLADQEHNEIDVIYARSMGRGKKAEADISWGENIANQITKSNQTILEEPPYDSSTDRLKKPHFLGIPLIVSHRYLGAIVFIRYGGPSFTPERVKFAEFISHQISQLIDRENLRQEFEFLEAQEKQRQLKDDFISTITHELRTPLGFIKGYTTTLLRSDTTWDKKHQEEFLQIIDQETDHLQQLIDNLLDSARLQSGQMKMKFQHVRLDALINGVIARANMNNPDMVFHLKLEPNQKPIVGDPQRLTQVVENLVSNARKYAPGSEIKITITQDENGGYISFHDFGPGISKQYLPYIFDRFFRIPEQSPTAHSSGLGLYICQQIIQMHNGKITATSSLGKGTTFKMFLPYEP